MPAKQQRVQVTLSPVVRALVEEVHKLTGTPRAALISEMLDDVAPVYQAQLDDPALDVKAQDCARRLGLAYERRLTGYGDLAVTLGRVAG